ncbi:transposase [Enterobacterales bacterium BIT-L3]|uniref:Transposase n=2 Tax=Tenebrionibacter/Tenebrionicola group TaxID=2969848 RepID=A0A8K0XW43_9ENTR|nr:transposase [Tenebrionibacter intestinalis]MBV5095161.1 transposase [Tenebrionicola larvae]
MKNVTISQSCGKGFVNTQTKYEATDPVCNAESMVGLDVGITKPATLSYGTIYAPVNRFKASQRKLATRQRQVNRKVKFSANRQKPAKTTR